MAARINHRCAIDLSPGTRPSPGARLPARSEAASIAPQASLIGSKPTALEHVARAIGRVGGHREMHRASPTFGRVHDLEVLDVHLALAEHRGEVARGHPGGPAPRPGARRPPLAPWVSRRAASAPLRLRERRARRRPPRPPTISSRRRRDARRTGRSRRPIARRFASRMSLHRRGFEAARRVRSRNPPAAQQQDLRLVGLLGRGEAHQRRRGDLRQVAHEGDEPIVALGVEPDRPRADEAVDASSASTASGPLASCGVIAQTIPSTTEAEACSGPERSLPPSDAPARTEPGSRSRRLGDLVAHERVFTLPTSVTIASGAASRHAATREATVGIGVATTTIGRRHRILERRGGPDSASAAARAATDASASHPVTPHRRERRRGRPTCRSARCRRRRRDQLEVIAQRLGPVEVDGHDLGRHRSVWRCIRMRTTSGIDPTTGISRAHISGTAQPHAAGGLRGNAEAMSSVTVNSTLIEVVDCRARWPRAAPARGVRSPRARTTASPRPPRSAPRTGAHRHRSCRRLARAPAGRRTSPQADRPAQRRRAPDLAAVERSQRTRGSRPLGRIRTDAQAYQARHRQTDRREQPTHLAFAPLGHDDPDLPPVAPSVDDTDRARRADPSSRSTPARIDARCREVGDPRPRRGTPSPRRTGDASAGSRTPRRS